MQAYVAGFLFNKEGTEVALIQKTKPEWQAGKLNAVGGKIETTEVNNIVAHVESPIDAMVREFEEETGVYIPPTEWKYKVRLFQEGVFEVFFFTCFSEVISEVTTTTEEEVEVWNVDMALAGAMLIDNLKWLIPLCLDKNVTGPVEVEEAPIAQAA